MLYKLVTHPWFLFQRHWSYLLYRVQIGVEELLFAVNVFHVQSCTCALNHMQEAPICTALQHRGREGQEVQQLLPGALCFIPRFWSFG